MNKYRELAAAIRKGHTMIGESPSFMPTSDESLCGCALTAAWYGIGKQSDDYWKARRNEVDACDVFSKVFGIDWGLAREISRKHCSGIKRLEIADWLDTLADETEAVPQRETDQAYATRKVAELMELVAA